MTTSEHADLKQCAWCDSPAVGYAKIEPDWTGGEQHSCGRHGFHFVADTDLLDAIMSLAALASTPSPAQPTEDERESLMLVLHDKGAYCGECDYEDAIDDYYNEWVEWRCLACKKTLGSYADGILAAGFHLAPSPVQGADDLTKLARDAVNAYDNQRDHSDADDACDDCWAIEQLRVALRDRPTVQGADDRLAQAEYQRDSDRLIRKQSARLETTSVQLAAAEAVIAEARKAVERAIGVFGNIAGLSRVLDALATCQQSPQAALNEVRAGALEEAADAWTQGAWAKTPRHPDRITDRLAASQYPGDWLRARAAELRAAPQAGNDNG